MLRAFYILWLTVAVRAVGGCDRPASSSAPAPAAPPAASSAAPAPVTAAISPDAGGASVSTPSPAFEAVVGEWHVAQAGGATGFEVDGSRSREDAFYPLAVHKAPLAPGDVRLSVRFYPIAGKIDQAAGIAFGITPSGSYQGVRANALEDNLLYFTVTNGKRNVIDTVRNVATPTRAWHTLVLELRGKQLSVTVDGAKRFEKTLESVPVGRVGLWSKADSQVLFDDFEVTKL